LTCSGWRFDAPRNPYIRGITRPEHVEKRVGYGSEAADAWGLPSGVGEVQKGSLEEALWGVVPAQLVYRRSY
jgi:hypothetical protein